MGNELEGVAKSLTDAMNGKNSLKLEQIIRLLSTESGKKILASLMADGGENVKRAANGAKNGDMSGVQNIISSIAGTEEGRNVLGELMRDENK